MKCQNVVKLEVSECNEKLNQKTLEFQKTHLRSLDRSIVIKLVSHAAQFRRWQHMKVTPVQRYALSHASTAMRACVIS